MERRLCLPDGMGSYESIWVRCGHFSGMYPSADRPGYALVYHGSIGGFVGDNSQRCAAPEPARCMLAIGTPGVSVVYIDDLRAYVRGAQ